MTRKIGNNVQFWLRSHEKGITLAFWMFIALVIIGLLFFNLNQVDDNTKSLIADNNRQTRILEKQNDRLQAQGKLLQAQNEELAHQSRQLKCLLDIHIAGRLPSETDCTHTSSSPSQTNTQNNTSPQKKAPTNTPNQPRRNPGGGDEPEEPSLLEQVVDFLNPFS